MVNVFGNRKGSIVDLIYMGLVLLIFSIIVLIGLNVGQSFQTQIKTMAILDSDGQAAVDQTVAGYAHTIDFSFLFLAIFIGLVTLILAAMVRVHPIFIIFFIIGWIFTVFLCGIFSNVYQSMAGQSQLIDTANQLVLITKIMEYLPLIVGIFGIILMVVMYKLFGEAQ